MFMINNENRGFKPKLVKKVIDINVAVSLIKEIDPEFINIEVAKNILIGSSNIIVEDNIVLTKVVEQYMKSCNKQFLDSNNLKSVLYNNNIIKYLKLSDNINTQQLIQNNIAKENSSFSNMMIKLLKLRDSNRVNNSIYCLVNVSDKQNEIMNNNNNVADVINNIIL